MVVAIPASNEWNVVTDNLAGQAYKFCFAGLSVWALSGLFQDRI